MTCHECKKDIPIVKDDIPGNLKRECYWLSNKSATNNKTLCVDCWEKSDKEKYKQQFDEITLHREKSPENDGFRSIFSHENKHIQATCQEDGCGKKFDCQTTEKLRHKWDGKKYFYIRKTGFYPLSSKDHEKLNKNPAPVKTMEDLVKQWMENESYQKIYWNDSNETYFDAIKKDGKKQSLNDDGWRSEVLKWLKTQPNKEFVNKGGDNPPERERAFWLISNSTKSNPLIYRVINC